MFLDAIIDSIDLGIGIIIIPTIVYLSYLFYKTEPEYIKSQLYLKFDMVKIFFALFAISIILFEGYVIVESFMGTFYQYVYIVLYLLFKFTLLILIIMLLSIVRVPKIKEKG